MQSPLTLTREKSPDMTEACPPSHQVAGLACTRGFNNTPITFESWQNFALDLLPVLHAESWVELLGSIMFCLVAETQGAHLVRPHGPIGRIIPDGLDVD